MAITVLLDASVTQDTRTLSWTIPTLAVGDVVVVTAETWDISVSLATPSGTGLTFTQRAAPAATNRDNVYIWTAVASSGGTNVVVTSVMTGSAAMHSGALYVLPTADGYSLAATPNVASSASITPGNQGSIALTGTSGNLYIVALGDWNGVATSATWLASATSDQVTQDSGINCQYSAHGTLTGASTTVGLTAPVTGTQYTIAAIEILFSGAAPTTPEQYAAHWTLVPPGGISPASPRQLPFPAFGTGDTTPNTPQLTTWFTRVGDTTTPELLVSAEDWGLLANGGLNHAGDFAATYDDYFSHRQAQGYNCILVSMFSFTTLSGGANGPDSDGTYPFNTNSTNPSNPANTTFWGRRDSFLATASTYGFRVMLNASTPLVHAGSFTASWTSTQWTDYGTFLGNRYPASTYPHILWMLGDDYFDDIDSNFTAFKNALRAAGATQPITIQNYQEASSRYDIYNGGTRPWGAANAEYNFGYSYNVSYDVVEKMGNEANPLPYFWGDGTFLNTGGITGLTDVQLMRRLVWWALSSGSKGFQVGDNDMWPWDATALGFVTSKTFYTTVIPAITTYFRSLPNWHQLKADTSSQLVIGGRGTHASPLVSGGSGGQYLSNSDAYVTASFIQSGLDAGELAVIYMSHGSTITIDESKMVAGYTATWVDPVTAATSAATPGTTYNSTAKGNNSDGQADWVLVLAAPSSGTNWTVSQTDGTGLTDSVVIDQFKASTDTEGLSDTTAVDQAKVATDNEPLTDSVVVDQAKVVTDTAGLTDTTTVENGRVVTQTDTEALTDTVVIDQLKTVTDSEGLSDAQVFDQFKVVTDSEGLTDSTLVENGKLVSQADPENLTDSVIFAVGEVKTDDAGVTDTTAVSQAKVTSDSEGLTDSALVENGRTVSQTDAAGMTDSVAIVLNAVQVDLVGLTDSVAITFSKILTDLVGLTDAATTTAGGFTVDPNPITLTLREGGHRTTVRAHRARLTIKSARTTTVRENHNP